MNIIKGYQKEKHKKRQYLTATDYIMMTRKISKVFFFVVDLFGRFYLAAFFADAAGFLAGLGLAAFLTAGFLGVADFAFFGAAAFLTLGADAGLAFFAGAAFFAAAGLAVVAFVFGLTCRGFLAALVAPADLGFELERALAALAALTFLGLAAGAALVALVDATGAADALPPVATFLADFVPADFDRARFLVPDAALELDVLFLVFLVDDDFFLVAVASPSLNEPLAPLPFVCLKCLALTPFFNANFKC